MPIVTLTDLTLRALPAPEKGNRVYIDGAGPTGFGVVVTSKGHRSFIINYGSDRNRHTIGQVGIIKLKDARQKAKEFLAKRTLNGDQVPSKTFANVLELFLAMKEQNNKASTAMETKRLLTKHFLPVLGAKRIQDIRTDHVMEIIDALASTPSEANHAFTAAKTFFRWVVARRYGPDPLSGLQKPYKAKSRKRALSDDELARVLRAAQMFGEYGALVQLLIFSGQRLGQIASLRREWIDCNEKMITFPGSAMKSGNDHTVPFGFLSEKLFQELPKEGLLFPTEKGEPFNSWSDPHSELLRTCGVAHFTRHDLRRTFATHHAKVGTPPHVVERMLDHRGGIISGVAEIYNRYSYMQEMRKAAAIYEAHLSVLISRAC